MVSYNLFTSRQNGWTICEKFGVLILQNEDTASYDMWGDTVWGTLHDHLPVLDKVVFYVGTHGAERIIELAVLNGLDPDRAVFVFCDCNLGKKMKMLKEYGFSRSQVISCECGGDFTMAKIFDNVLKYGEISV